MASFAMERGRWSNVAVSCFERVNVNDGIFVAMKGIKTAASSTHWSEKTATTSHHLPSALSF
jgi:hypothetical protein